VLLGTLDPFPFLVLFLKGKEGAGGRIRSNADYHVRIPAIHGGFEGGHFLPDHFRDGLDRPHITALAHCALKVKAGILIAKYQPDRHCGKGAIGRVILITVVNELPGASPKEFHFLTTGQGILNYAGGFRQRCWRETGNFFFGFF
jgi:hypothetical protein